MYINLEHGIGTKAACIKAYLISSLISRLGIVWIAPTLLPASQNLTTQGHLLPQCQHPLRCGCTEGQMALALGSALQARLRILAGTICKLTCSSCSIIDTWRMGYPVGHHFKIDPVRTWIGKWRSFGEGEYSRKKRKLCHTHNQHKNHMKSNINL